MFRNILFFFIFLIFGACQTTQKNSQKAFVVCTTSLLADAVEKIVGDSIEVKSIMGAGVDPHLYKATQGDLEKLTQADIVFYNGLHLEGKMSEILEKLARQKDVRAATDALDKKLLRQTSPNTYDPHVWFDVQLWAKVVAYLSQELQKKYPEKKAFFEANTQKYLQELQSLDQEVRSELAKIAPEKRVLITSHDAFSYFGNAYQIEVKALQGISTLADFGLNDITQLVDFIVERKLGAVFVESSVSPKSIEALIEGCKDKGQAVKIGCSLFSDALGEKNTPQGTYVGMFRHNLNCIVGALE